LMLLLLEVVVVIYKGGAGMRVGRREGRREGGKGRAGLLLGGRGRDGRRCDEESDSGGSGTRRLGPRDVGGRDRGPGGGRGGGAGVGSQASSLRSARRVRRNRGSEGRGGWREGGREGGRGRGQFVFLFGMEVKHLAEDKALEMEDKTRRKGREEKHTLKPGRQTHPSQPPPLPPSLPPSLPASRFTCNRGLSSFSRSKSNEKSASVRGSSSLLWRELINGWARA
jgi:hypothetical protein